MAQVGIDLAKAKFDACLLVDGKKSERVFSNNGQGFREFCEWLRSKKAVDAHACMEGTGRLWEPIAEFLHEQKMTVSVVNPLKIKGFARSELRRSKTDRLDAAIIARFCRAMVPSRWNAPRAEAKKVRDIQRLLEALIANRTQEKNRLTAGVLDPDVISVINKHIQFLDAEIAELQAKVIAMAKADAELNRKVELLVSIPGVGEATALTFLTELPDLDHFTSGKQVEMFCGISPRQFVSGSSVRARARISKIGNGRIRGRLYMPALAAMRTNPILKAFAERLKKNGKPGLVIVCAIIRKLIRIMFAVVKSGRPFDPHYVSTAS